MELRSCNHLHFIQAVKGGLVTKIVNITRGRPALKFKRLQEIYESVDVKVPNLFPIFCPENGIDSFSFDDDSIETKIPCLPLADRRTIKKEPEVSNLFCNAADKIINKDAVDPGFGNMTLNQIKERCKAKKRKRSKSIDPSKETAETYSLEQVKVEEEDFDLMEPLISWKSKLSKDMKVKKKGIKNKASNSLQRAIAIVKPEEVPSDDVLMQSCGDSWPALNIKLEVPELHCSDCQNVNCVGGNSSLICTEPKGSLEMVSRELCETADEYVMETRLSIVLRKEPQHCITDDMSYDYVECADPQPLQYARSSCEYMECADPQPLQYARSSCEYMECADPQPLQYARSSCEYMECADPQPLQYARSSCDYSVKPDNTETASHEYSDFPVPESEKVTHPVPNDTPSEIISSMIDHRSCVSGNSESSSPMNEMFLQINNEVKPLMALELCGGGDACVSKDIIRADLPSNPEVSVIANSTNDCSFSPDSCLVSVVNDQCGDKQSQKSACSNAETNDSGAINPFDATDELMITAGFGHCRDSKSQQPPERLFATRKAISPTSQERLLKAMNSFELPDDENYKCRRELYFGKNKFDSIEGPNQISGVGLNINRQQITRKTKNHKRRFHHSGVPNVPHLPCAVPRFSTGCTSIQSCSESAIEFSQQQMKDFECLAMKLTKELQIMKDIVEERMLPQTCSASSLKYNVDRARMAIRSATRVEESTKRWLSMMARDCNRFCRIMRMTEKGSVSSGNVVQTQRKKSTFVDEADRISVDQSQRLAEAASTSSGNVVQKERKKITFADEAGGTLCHVRFFEDETASFSESDTEKEVLLAD